MELKKIQTRNKSRWYQEVTREFLHTIEKATHPISIYANAASILHHYLKNINWVGFYLFEEGTLILGPFQGKAAVPTIALSEGVCGAAASQHKTMVVEDVHQFCGHIACDIRSKSEIVIPIQKNNVLLGVLDIDSPIVGRFSEEDQKGLEEFVLVLSAHV